MFVFVHLYICMFSVYLCVSVFSFATRVWLNKMNIMLRFLHGCLMPIQSYEVHKLTVIELIFAISA